MKKLIAAVVMIRRRERQMFWPILVMKKMKFQSLSIRFSFRSFDVESEIEIEFEHVPTPSLMIHHMSAVLAEHHRHERSQSETQSSQS